MMRERTENRLTVFLLTFSILSSLLLPVLELLPTPSEADIYNRVIRLHVLANSDSEADQAKKLAVRDEILNVVGTMLNGVSDRGRAEEILRVGIPEIETAAKEVLNRQGAGSEVRVTLTKEPYPTRNYGNVSLPTGTYTSLRVLIGEAAGQNWWCVLFPQLCITGEAGEPDEEQMIEAGLTPSQIRLITGNSPKIVIKFRLLEWISAIFSKFSA